MEDNTQDSIDQLDEEKVKAQQQIASTKLLLKARNKELRDIDKLNQTLIENKQQLYDDKWQEILTLQNTLIEEELKLKVLSHNKDDETEEKVQAALQRVKTEWIDKNLSGAFIVEDQKFVFIEDCSQDKAKLNVQFNHLETNRFADYLAMKLKIKSWHLPVLRLKDLFNANDRSCLKIRHSLSPSLWGKSEIYLPIQMMEEYFINKMSLTPEESAVNTLDLFDCLMHSLSGGKKENQDHIEQFILHKIINYSKAVTTPDVIIIGHVGGNGKGIIQAMIKLMFPSSLSGKANNKTLIGNFNAIMLGKLLVFFDDQVSNEIPLEVIKQLAGSESMIFEEKGKDQYESEKTHSSMWFNQSLMIKLTPAGQEGGVDRRFSVMRTSITFLESLRELYKRERNLVITIEESKALAEKLVSDVLLNRVHIAAWIQHLQKKHPQVNKDFTLKALHGEDYQYFLDAQSTGYDSVFRDLIVPVIQSGQCVPVFIISELLRHLEGKIVSDKTIVKRMEELAQQNKLDITSSRRMITINCPSSEIDKRNKKQCVVIHPRGVKEWKDHSFDWSLVSSQPYQDTLARHGGGELIPDSKLVFGINNADLAETHESEYFSEESANEQSGYSKEHTVLSRLIKRI